MYKRQFIGDLKIWIDNHPYASFSKFDSCALPKRSTVIRAYGKYTKDREIKLSTRGVLEQAFQQFGKSESLFLDFARRYFNAVGHEDYPSEEYTEIVFSLREFGSPKEEFESSLIVIKK